MTSPVPREATLIITPPAGGLCFAPARNRNRMVRRVNGEEERYRWNAQSPPLLSEGEGWHRSDPSDATSFKAGATCMQRLYGRDWPSGPWIIENGYNPITEEGDDNQAESDYLVVPSQQQWHTRLPQLQAGIDAYHGPLLGLVAFFCHGSSGRIQLGAGMTGAQRRPTETFLESIAEKSLNDLIVIFYACNTARKPNAQTACFAGWVQRQLYEQGLTECVVLGRTTAGNGLTNPHTQRFEGDRSAESEGTWIVPPGDPLWNTWRLALTRQMRDESDEVTENFRYQFPFLEIEQIRAYLETLQPLPENGRRRHRRRRPRHTDVDESIESEPTDGTGS